MSRRSTQKPSQKSPGRRGEASHTASSSSSSAASRGTLAAEPDVTMRSPTGSKSPRKQSSTRRSHSKTKSPRKDSPMQISPSRPKSPLLRSPPRPKSPMQVSPTGSKSPLPRSPTETVPTKADSPSKRSRSRPKSPMVSPESPQSPPRWASPKTDSPTKRSRSRPRPESPLGKESPKKVSPTKRSHSRTQSPVASPNSPQSPPRWVSPKTDRPTKRSSSRTLKVTPESLRSSSGARSPRKKTSPVKSPAGKKSPAKETATLKSPPKRKLSKSPKRPTTLELSEARPGSLRAGKLTPFPHPSRLRPIAPETGEQIELPSTSRAVRKQSYVFLPTAEGVDRDRLCVMMSQLYGYIKTVSTAPTVAAAAAVAAAIDDDGDADSEGSYDLTADCRDDFEFPIDPDSPIFLKKVTDLANLTPSPMSTPPPPRPPSSSTSASSASNKAGDASRSKPDSPSGRQSGGASASGSASQGAPSRSGPGSSKEESRVRPPLVRRRAVDFGYEMPIEMIECHLPRVATGAPQEPESADAPDIPAAPEAPEAVDAPKAQTPPEELKTQTPPTPPKASDVPKTPTSPDAPKTPTPATPPKTSGEVKATAPSPGKRRHSKEKDPDTKADEPSLKPARKKSFDGSSRLTAATITVTAQIETQDMGPPQKPGAVVPYSQLPAMSRYREVRPSIESEDDIIELPTPSRISTETPPPTSDDLQDCFGSGSVSKPPSMAVSPPLPAECYWRMCYRLFLREFNRKSADMQEFLEHLSSNLVERIRDPSQSAPRRFFLIAGLTIWLLIREASYDFWFLCGCCPREEVPRNPTLLSPDQALEFRGLEESSETAVKPKKSGKASRKAFKRLKYRQSTTKKPKMTYEEREEVIQRLLAEIRRRTPIGRLSPRRDFTPDDCPFITISFQENAPPVPGEASGEATEENKDEPQPSTSKCYLTVPERRDFGREPPSSDDLPDVTG